MAGEEYRLLGAALGLVRFTSADLARAAGVKPNTVASWLRRHGDLVEVEEKSIQSSAGDERSQLRAGRRPHTWRVRTDAIPKIHRILEQLYPAIITDSYRGTEVTAQLDSIRNAERAYDNWQAARKSEKGDLAATFLSSLRAWIRSGWEDLANIHAALGNVPVSAVNQLATLEREARILDVPAAVEPLASFAAWVASQFARILDRTGNPAFAPITVLARARAGSDRELTRVVASSLAAPVWSDESVVRDSDADPETLGRCSLIASELPRSDLLNRVSDAIDSGAGIRLDSHECQTVVLGLVIWNRKYSPLDSEVRNWLSHLRGSNDWRSVLALPALYGLMDAPSMRMQEVLNRLKGDISPALEETRTFGRMGTARGGCVQYAERMLALQNPSGSPTTGERELMGYFAGSGMTLASAAI